MRLVFVFMVILVLPNLNFAKNPSVYCTRYMYRTQKVNENGVVKNENVKISKTICCKGYKKKGAKCIPLCEKGCMNAKCVAPNVCKCETGFKKLNEYRCEPICHHCKYGVCTAPGICNCYSGYEKNTTTGRCEPTCNPPCVNGYCSDPDFCLCDEGYHISKTNVNICISSTTAQPMPTTVEYIEETSTQLYLTTVDEALDSSSTVEPVEQTVSQEAKEYQYSTEIVDETTPEIAFGETTEEVHSSSEIDVVGQIYITHHELVDFKYSTENVDPTTSELEDEKTTEGTKIRSSSDNVDISSTLVESSSQTPTSDEALQTSNIEEHLTKEEIVSETDALSFGITTDNDIQFVPVSKPEHSTESTNHREITKGTETNDSSIIKAEINSSSDRAIVWIPVFIASLAVFLIVAIILMTTFARKYFEGKVYNIAKLEKRKGIVTFSSGKENVITAW